MGFTAGIAVIILASQIRNLFGLSLHDAEPPALLPKLAALGNALDQAAGAAAGDADHCPDRRAAGATAKLARHPDRRRCRNRDGVGAGIAGGNDRHPFRRDPGIDSVAGIAEPFAAEDAGSAARCHRLRVARIDFALGAVLFINRMAEATGIEAGIPLAAGDRADDANGERRPYDASLANDPDVMVYRITGAFFFGAAAAIGTALDSISDRHKAFVIDFAAVPLLDSTAAITIHRMAVIGASRGKYACPSACP